MVANNANDLRLGKVAQELETLIESTLMTNRGTIAGNEFIDGLRSLTFNDNKFGPNKSSPVTSNDIASMSIFGDDQLSEKVAEVKKCLDMKKPYSNELRELVSYLRLISTKSSGSKYVRTSSGAITKKEVAAFSSYNKNTNNRDEVTFNMITDREIDAIEQSNIDKINEKVISMKSSMDGVEAKLDQLVKQQSELLGTTPEPVTADEKIEALNHSVNCIANAVDNLCEYITYSDVFQSGYDAAVEERGLSGDSTMIATDVAAKHGLNPGEPGYKEFIEGYKQGDADAGDGAAMAQLHSLGMDGITYSDAHDAFFSEDGDMYIYSADIGEYVEPRTGEILCYSATDNLFFSEDIGLNDEYEGNLYTADGDAVEIYSDEDGDLYDEYGDEVIYSADADAFFSARGTMLFSEDAFQDYDDDDEYYSDEDDGIEVVDMDEDGNAVCYSAYDNDYYYYSAYDDEAYSTSDLLAFSENDDIIQKEVEVYDKDSGALLDKSEQIEVRDNSTGEVVDRVAPVEVNDSTNDMILHSESTGNYYFYSAEDDELFSEDELVEFSKTDTDDGRLGEVTNYSIYNKADNRSDAAITTFSFLENNGGLLDESNAVDRYNALQDYLGKTEFDQ